RNGRLAGAESLQMNFGLHLLHAAGEAGIKIATGDEHLELAVEAVRDGFGNLHVCLSNPKCRLPGRSPREACPPSPSGFGVAALRRSRGTDLVRAEGLEPPRLSSLEPKSSASTSSATPASGPPIGSRRPGSRAV